MNENQWFEQMKMWRGWTVEILKSIPQEIGEEIPKGFNNHILWNAGHILDAWDQSMLPTVGMERQMPLAYHSMFSKGSKPADWTNKPPDMDELINRLEEQPRQIEKTCSGHLNDELEEPFLHMETLEEMAVFLMSHETLHVGTIKGMKTILFNR